jgi:hypothetical protein
MKEIGDNLGKPRAGTRILPKSEVFGTILEDILGLVLIRHASVDCRLLAFSPVPRR